MSLTDRDKKLLYALAVIVIVVVFGRFLILPMFDKHQDLADQLTEVENTKSEMEMQIASLPTMEQNVKNSQTQLVTLKDQFYEKMESHAAERMITRIFLNHDLTTKDLTLDAEPQLATISPYFASEMAATVAAQNAPTAEESKDSESSDSSSSNSADSTSAEASKASAAESSDASSESTSTATDTENADATITQNSIYSYTVQVTAEGRDANMKQLIDDLIRNYPGILVTNYSMGTQTGNVSGTGETVIAGTLTIGLNMYMVEK